MTSFNYDRYIASAIESVLSQTFSDLELIIVDDASSDRSCDVIRSYLKKDERIKAIFHKDNQGISKTVNDGWRAAQGRFIASISSDDIWAENKLDRQMDVLQDDDDLLVWTEGEIIDAFGRSTGGLFTKVHGAGNRKKCGDIFEELLKGNFIFASSRIFKKDNLQGRGYSVDLKYLSDYRFAVDMASLYDYHFIKEPLTKYRMHGNNTANRDWQGYEEDYIKLANYFLSTYGEMIPIELSLNLHRSSLDALKSVDALKSDEALRDQIAQIERRDNQIHKSIIKQALMAYQGIAVMRGLPLGTWRRDAYDRFIDGWRRIMNRRSKKAR